VGQGSEHQETFARPERHTAIGADAGGLDEPDGASMLDGGSLQPAHESAHEVVGGRLCDRAGIHENGVARGRLGARHVVAGDGPNVGAAARAPDDMAVARELCQRAPHGDRAHAEHPGKLALAGQLAALGKLAGQDTFPQHTLDLQIAREGS